MATLRKIGLCVGVATAAVGLARAAGAQQAPAAGAPAPAALPAGGASAGTSDADLAKQLSNPLAALVAVPFQFNWEQGVGFEDGTRTIVNVQPVVPFELNDEWNLIGRWIMPFVSQPPLTPGSESSYGLARRS